MVSSCTAHSRMRAAEPGGFRRRLQPRNPSYRKPRRAAGGLQGDRDRSRAVAATRCACAAPPRQRFRHRVGAAEEFRLAVVAGPCAAPSACRRFRGMRPGRVRQSRSRCDPTSGGHRSGSVDRRRAARQRLLIPAKAGIQNWRLNFSKYWVPVYAGTSDRERAFSTAGTGRRACPGCARGWAEGYEPHRPYWLARAQSRRRGGGSA